MNIVNFKIAPIYSRKSLLLRLLIWGLCILSYSLWSVESVHAWGVDFSRRRLEFDKIQDESRMPASMSASTAVNADAENKNPLAKVFESTEVAKDIVILHTEKGFVPDMVQLRQGSVYRFHVVNVDEKKRNVSIVVDAFAQHHNTIFGAQKSFQVSPKTEGIFSYQCPESAYQGKIVVIPQERKPASSN